MTKLNDLHETAAAPDNLSASARDPERFEFFRTGGKGDLTHMAKGPKASHAAAPLEPNERLWLNDEMAGKPGAARMTREDFTENVS